MSHLPQPLPQPDYPALLADLSRELASLQHQLDAARPIASESSAAADAAVAAAAAAAPSGSIHSQGNHNLDIGNHATVHHVTMAALEQANGALGAAADAMAAAASQLGTPTAAAAAANKRSRH